MVDRRLETGRRVLAALLVVLAVGVVGYGVMRASVRLTPTAQSERPPAVADDGAPPGKFPAVDPSAGPLGSGSPRAAAASGAAAPVPASVPQRGATTFTYTTTTGPLLGRSGTLKRFRIAVENGVGQDANAFAADVDRALGDPRSWIAGGQWRLQRVAKAAAAEFTIYLASQITAEQMCASGGLHTLQYASCRLPGQVIINLTRWLTATPDYGATLDVYRLYAINHEVGHELGHGHEACPGAGQPAPVMQQQTFGLNGCVANPWPYVNGQRYAGAPIP